jgi:predicted type IV restriction endonuclease
MKKKQLLSLIALADEDSERFQARISKLRLDQIEPPARFLIEKCDVLIKAFDTKAQVRSSHAEIESQERALMELREHIDFSKPTRHIPRKLRKLKICYEELFDRIALRIEREEPGRIQRLVGQTKLKYILQLQGHRQIGIGFLLF